MTPFLSQTLESFRVVSLTGPRQVGKTTLLQAFCGRDRKYVSLEDPVAASTAAEDPGLWLDGNPPPLGIDEVQRVPGILPAIKRAVDRRRKPGDYLITGSALWLSMKNVSESLAGRVALLELWPFRRAEWLEREPLDFRSLFTESLEDLVKSRPVPEGIDWLKESIFQGGFPVPAEMTDSRQRRTWFRSYVATYLERDVRDLARIENLAAYRRVMTTLLARTGQLLNASALARDAGVPQPTVSRYVEWLQATYQCFLLPPYFMNIEKRLVKTPKVYWSDTGMLAALLDLQDWRRVESHGLAGRLIETWVAGELKKYFAASGGGAIHFFRVHGGPEIDFIIDLGAGKIGGLEVKASQRIDPRDLAGFEVLKDQWSNKFHRGIVLYAGRDVIGLGKDLYAVPLGLLA